MTQIFKIKSFKGGISDYEDAGIQGSFKFGSNLDIHRNIDSLTPGYALSDDLAVGTMTALTLFIVPSSDGNTYFFNADGKIYKRTSGGTYTLVYTDADGVITGACEFPQNNGKSYLFWSTSIRLRAKEIPGNSGWSDVDASIVNKDAVTYTYPKTNLTSATWHTMKQINGVLLIANKSEVAMVGYDGSYTTSALQLIPGNLSKCLMENKGYAYIGGTKVDLAQNAELFVWDTAQSLNWNTKNTVPSSAINALINAEYPLMQVGTSGQILLADPTNYTLPIVSFPGGGQVKPDAVEVDSGMALFGSYGNGTGKSGVYSYGRKKKNANSVLNLEYALDCDEIGSIRKVGTTLLIAYKNGSDYGVKKVSTDRAVGTYESLDLVFPTSSRETVLDKIRLITAPLPSGTSIEAYRRMDKTGDFVKCYLEGGSESFNITNGKEVWFLVGDTGKIAEIKLILRSNGVYAPEVYSIEAYFS